MWPLHQGYDNQQKLVVTLFIIGCFRVSDTQCLRLLHEGWTYWKVAHCWQVTILMLALLTGKGVCPPLERCNWFSQRVPGSFENKSVFKALFGHKIEGHFPKGWINAIAHVYYQISPWVLQSLRFSLWYWNTCTHFPWGEFSIFSAAVPFTIVLILFQQVPIAVWWTDAGFKENFPPTF